MRITPAVLLGLAVLAACSKNPAPATAPQPAPAAAPAAPPPAPAPAPAAAPAAMDLSGAWTMSVDAGGQMIPVDINLARSGSNYTGSLEAQGQGNATLTALTIEGDRLSMTFSGPNGDAVFRGTLSADRRSAAGNLDYAGQNFPFTMTKR